MTAGDVAGAEGVGPRLRVVAGLGKRGEREWKRVVMVLVFVVGGVGGVGF